MVLNQTEMMYSGGTKISVSALGLDVIKITTTAPLFWSIRTLMLTVASWYGTYYVLR